VLPRRYYRWPRISQPSREGAWWLLSLVLMLAALLSLAWLSFDYGRQRAGYDSAEMHARITRLQRELKDVSGERDRLREQAALLQRTSQIDRAAARDAQQQVKAFQDEKLKLEEQLALLRGVLEPGEDNDGIRVHDLKLQRAADPHVYHYRFLVSQLNKEMDTATGSIFISVSGRQGGKARELGLADMTANGGDSLRMRFKYFQNLSGRIALPEGFVPKHFTVNVKPSGKHHSSVTQVFDWAVGD